jgi:hypothetical protein
MWDFDNDDGCDEEQPPISATPAPPPVVDIKPLASRVPTPSAWLGQPIDVFYDSNRMHVPGTSTLEAKKKRAEQVQHPRCMPHPNAVPAGGGDDDGSDEEDVDGEPNLPPQEELTPPREAPQHAPRRPMRLKWTSTVTMQVPPRTPLSPCTKTLEGVEEN